ncbi:uncharacterized protein LOC134728095 [Mytilus trossulus]|uniref:uncharacterized protein LOC134728095 n=1 Tax=Mytilus trossulus TaxID=6551 RepID=UPI0030062C72
MEILIWAVCFNLVSVSISNQFDPHVYPAVGPFFEGWYMRLIDFSTNNSYGLLFGHVLSAPSTNSSSPKVLASLLHRNHCIEHNNTCKLYSTNVVCHAKDVNVTVRNGPVIKNPDDKSPPHFTWQTPFGLFTQTNNITTFRFDFGKYIFRGIIGQPVPWGPDGEGPEGWIDKLPFVPLHWFVFSLRSPVIQYELLDVQTGQLVGGTNGVVHMEKNWGNSFPKGWIWSQGVSRQNISFALSGGLVSLGGITTTQYLMGYRNLAKNLNLNYRPGNAMFSATHNGCGGLFEIKVYGVLHEIHLSASADLSTFSDCLYGPEITGFRQACIESYDAIINITVFKREFLSLKKIDTQIIKFSALEFGGTYTCNGQCQG